jgi:hypothetical protein
LKTQRTVVREQDANIYDSENGRALSNSKEHGDFRFIIVKTELISLGDISMR